MPRSTAWGRNYTVEAVQDRGQVIPPKRVGLDLPHRRGGAGRRPTIGKEQSHHVP